MTGSKNTWVIVLAAGEGRRLSAFTADSQGNWVPKQYCSFGRDRPMLHWAIERARSIAPLERIVAIVAEEHRTWWERDLAALPRRNVVSQPRNRGTAAGILLPAIEILRRDPDATIVVMPSDHHVSDEEAFLFGIERTIEVVGRADRAVLLGIAPDEVEPEYGWIVPGRLSLGTRTVARFVEKPGAELAAQLLGQGAVWNSFVLAVTGRTLLDLYSRTLPEILEPFLLELVVRPRARSLEELYAALPVKDFSRDLLERVPDRLALVVAPPCGWTDLGTPARLGRFLEAPSANLSVA